jgi:hypothetical protein
VCELCFFFISVKIIIFSAQIYFLYLKSSQAHDSIYHSSATCPKTNPSALIKSKSHAFATASASLLPAASIWIQSGILSKILLISSHTAVIAAVISGQITLFIYGVSCIFSIITESNQYFL